MIDFPASPTLGQQFTASGVIWVWDGTKWTATGLNVAYLPLSGGSMTGPIVLAADPASAMQAATRQYVDAQNAAQPVAMNDNRIINGDMRIDQRWNGASNVVTGYTIDRWQYISAQASKGTWGRDVSNLPSFPYRLGFASSSAYASLAADYFFFIQSIEADMVSDFAWGTAGAQSVTLSFWVNCTLTGTLSGAISNAAGTRCYPFTYSIPVASTWTRIVITIPGDPTGAWVMSGNAASMSVSFDLGCGSGRRGPAGAWATTTAANSYLGATGSVSVVGINSALFQVTGVKLEIGSVATPYNRQSLAKSMADCQRYYQSFTSIQVCTGSGSAGVYTTSSIILPVQMRAVPTLVQSGNAYGQCTGVSTAPVSSNVINTYLSGCNASTSCYAQFNLTASAEI
jgi:hypothetical protein